MDRQDDLARRLIDVGNDVCDEGPEQPSTGAWSRLAHFRQPQIVGQPGEIGRRSAGLGIRTASSRAWHASTRRSAACQVFDAATP